MFFLKQGEEITVLVNQINKRHDNEAHTGLAREFALQIIHEPIVISANGFFDINLDLLGSVLRTLYICL